MKGELGKLYGGKILESSIIPENQMLLIGNKKTVAKVIHKNTTSKENYLEHWFKQIDLIARYAGFYPEAFWNFRKEILECLRCNGAYYTIFNMKHVCSHSVTMQYLYYELGIDRDKNDLVKSAIL